MNEEERKQILARLSATVDRGRVRLAQRLLSSGCPIGQLRTFFDWLDNTSASRSAHNSPETPVASRLARAVQPCDSCESTEPISRAADALALEHGTNAAR